MPVLTAWLSTLKRYRLERISVEQAVAGYTRGSAYARFSEDTLGTLEPEKEADLAVISQDIFTVAHDSIARTKVPLTMVGGKVVFRQGN
jgi:predicted amidohydrolase YtcJ